MLMLLVVCDSYDEFYDQQSSVMAAYPDIVQNELKSYSKSITSYFCVRRSTKNVRHTHHMSDCTWFS